MIYIQEATFQKWLSVEETSLKQKQPLDLAPNQHNLFVFDFSRNVLWKGFGPNLTIDW